MTWFINALKDYPELAFFLTLAIGYAVGKIQIGKFKVGSVTGVLITGVVIGQLNITINPTVKAVFFLLFLFALGYNAGPQFFKGLKKDGLPQVLFSIIVCVIGLAATIIVAKILGYNAGQAGGLAAGALTQSATIGVAQDAISKLTLSAADKKSMSDFVPVGYAVTYIFGTIGTAFILSSIGPKILGVDLEEESKKLESNQNEVEEGHGVFSGASDLDYRAYVLNDKFIGKTVEEIEKDVACCNIRAFILRIRRNDEMITPDENTVVQDDDRVVFSFKTEELNKVDLLELGQEISDFRLLNFPIERLKVYVKSDKVINQTIGAIRDKTLTRGVYISKLQATGEEVPYDHDTVIHKKDVVTLTGPKEEVEKIAYKIGKPARDSSETDMIFVGLGILLGGLIGIPALTIAGVGITLSTSGGALIMGLIFGLIHSRRPTIGRIPEGTIWFLTNVGLASFVAVVGINAGPGFISGIKTSGISFLIAGIVVTMIPTFAGILLGKYVFKWKAPIILGACAGALTTTAAIGAITEKAKSNAPVLGYTVTYAVGNILLTVWGSIIILFFSK
ncbi:MULTISPECIES: aspartate-alanine antiporter [Bacillus]|uniref:aspartate-alanine antiporter n=1 Tax=Bacillus TaxID=1386 RepID=UPI0002F9ACD5|nr:MULTISPECIES: aspartate-alanine antiporter [Bacillus]